MSIGEWKKRWQRAEVIAPEGLREKRAKQNKEDVHIDWVFKRGSGVESLPLGMRGEFNVEYFDMCVLSHTHPTTTYRTKY